MRYIKTKEDFISEKKSYQLNEGQFSWMTQDSNKQIGSEKQNTIDVYMYDNEGNKWKETRYDGYGVFGGMDFYDLVATMNGYDADRQKGIDLAFGKLKTKDKKRKTLFPALVENPRYNWKRHDFTEQPENDPDQSWYQEEEDDRYGYDDYYESVDESTAKNVLKDAVNALTKTFAGKKLDKNYIKDYLKSIEMMARKNPMDFVKGYGEFTNDDWVEDVRYNMANEKVNEGRASADRLLKDVINGNTSEVEGIKLSKDMAQGFADWLRYSTYGKKFGSLPFDKLFTAAFNWGLDRFVKGANTKVKDEFKELKAKAKEMRKVEMKGESLTEAKEMSKKEVRDLKIKINNARTIGKYFTKDEVEFLQSLFESTVNEGKGDKAVSMAQKKLDKVMTDLKANLLKFKGAKTDADKETFKTEAGRLTKLRKDAQDNLEQAIQDAYADVELMVIENYDNDQRKAMAEKGLALPDGSFPIKNLEDLKNAIQAYGRAKDQAAAAKFIVKRAKALSADDLIPDTEDFQKALKEASFGRIPKFGK